MESRRTRNRPLRSSRKPESPSLNKSPVKSIPRTKSPSKRSPSATKKSARNTSPSRRKSPADTKLTSRTRQVKGTELRKSVEFIDESSSAKYGKKEKVSPKKTTSLKPVLKSSSKDRSKEEEGTDSEVSALTRLTSYIRRSLSSNPMPVITPTPTTELSRQSRSVSRSIFDDEDNYSRTEYSDQENDEDRSSYSKTFYKTSKVTFARQSQNPREYFGAIGVTLYLILIPSFIFYLQWLCSKNVCTFKPINTKSINLTSMRNFFNPDLVGSYIIFSTGIYILSAIPIGRSIKLNIRDGFEYNFNAFPMSIIIVAFIFTAEYFKYNLLKYILDNYLKLCSFSLISAFILAICSYIRSKYASENNLNLYAKSGIFLHDFFVGREINPRLFGIIDIKLSCYRKYLFTTLILGLAIAYKSIKLPIIPPGSNSTEQIIKYIILNLNYDKTALLSSVILILYILDSIIFEHHLASSFELQYEGVGAQLLLRYAAFPFMFVIIPKYILDNRPIVLPSWVIGIILCIFVCGLLVKRLSNRIKYNYRINPNNIKLLTYDTVPTFQGKRLLLDFWWGSVRQPNYAGEILCLISMSIPVFYKFTWPPLISLIMIIFYLLHRILRINRRNFLKYNSAWTRYCSKVPKYIVPKVF